MSSDDSLARQLRFSIFLQSFAALLFGGAFLVRAFTIGWDALTIAFAFFMVVAVAAAVFTSRKARALRP